MLELGEAEYMVRSSAYLKSLDDFRRTPLLTTDAGVSVRLRDVARRREFVKTDSPDVGKERLLLSLRGAISKSDGGASLLAELARRPALTIDQDTVMRSDDPGPRETGDIAVERNQAGDIDSAASVATEPSPAGTVVAIHDVAPPPVPTPPMAADPCSSTLTY